MLDTEQRRWERTLDGAQDIRRGEPPQRVLSSLVTEFETSTPANLPAYAVRELIMALLTALQAETRSQLKRLCDDDVEMPRRRQFDEEVSARSPAIPQACWEWAPGGEPVTRIDSYGKRRHLQ